MDSNKLLGGFYGLVLGDAVGVPFEFQQPRQLPPLSKIDIVMADVPKFTKTYPQVPYGTWSDDTALSLCLLDALLDFTEPEMWHGDFVENMQNWRFHGKFTPYNEKKFDIGLQTAMALTELEDGLSIQARVDGPDRCGNGALMRSLPVALVYAYVPDHDVRANLIANVTLDHVNATHANMMSKIVSLAYTLLASYLLDGVYWFDAIDLALDKTEQLLGEAYKDDMLKFRAYEHREPTGTGYSVDTFWSAIYALKAGSDFRTTIQHAISLGNDTDTTACVAGGLAGIIYGFDRLPVDWLAHLRDKQQIDQYAQRLLIISL